MFSGQIISARYPAGTPEHARTSKHRGRVYVKGGGNYRSGVRDAFGGYNQTFGAPTRRLYARTRSSGRKDRCVAPCKVDRAQGLARTFVKLL